MRERDLMERLHARYSFVRPYTDARRYAVAEHVPTRGPGIHLPGKAAEYMPTRVADFLAYDTYMSTLGRDGRRIEHAYKPDAPQPEYRYVLHGHEIKISRSDWIAELAQPLKAEAWKRHCDMWWLVAPKEVVRDDLPEDWGLIVPTKTGLRVAVQAPLLDPIPMPTSAMSQFLRSVQKTAAKRAAQVVAVA